MKAKTFHNDKYIKDELQMAETSSRQQIIAMLKPFSEFTGLNRNKQTEVTMKNAADLLKLTEMR